MYLTSRQGVVLADVRRSLPDLTVGATSQIVDGFDPIHHHLVWSHDAGAQVRTARWSMLVTSPTGLWIPGGHPYTVEASSTWWTARFAVDSSPMSWRRITTVGLDEVVAPMLAHLHYHPGREWSGELLSSVVAHLEDHFAAQPSTLRFPTDPRARDVADGIIADPASELDLHDWAELVGASERTLRRLFAEQTGMPFRTWRAKARLQAAVRMLTSGRPVGDVARRCGYGSTIAFSRAFAGDYGMTPSDYLKRRDADVGPTSASAPGSWPVTSPSWPVTSLPFLDALARHVSERRGVEMSNRARTRALATAGALLLVAAACGSDDDDSDGGASESTSSSAPSTADASAPADAPTQTSEADEAAAGADLVDFAEPIAAFEVVEERDETLVVRHAFGETEIPADPQRIVADDTMLEILLSLDMVPVAAQTRYADGVVPAPLVEPLVADLEMYPRGLTNFEAIAALDPDLIIGIDWTLFADDPQETYDLLSQIAPTVIVRDDPQPFWRETTEVVASAFGRTDMLEELERSYDDTVASQCERIRTVIAPDDTAALVEVYDDSFWLLGPGFVDGGGRYLPVHPTLFAYETCGIIPGEENRTFAASEPAQLSLELLPELQSDHLFVIATEGSEAQYDEIRSSSFWDLVPAAETGNVYVVDSIVGWGYLSAGWALEQRADAIVGTG